MKPRIRVYLVRERIAQLQDRTRIIDRIRKVDEEISGRKQGLIISDPRE